jgi:hypothetical protein
MVILVVIRGRRCVGNSVQAACGYADKFFCAFSNAGECSCDFGL